LDNDGGKQKRKTSLEAAVLLIFLPKQRDKSAVRDGQLTGYCMNSPARI
jgi:hypothetical protein